MRTKAQRRNADAFAEPPCQTLNSMNNNDIRIECDGFLLRPFVPEDAQSVTRHADNIRIWNNVRDQFPHPYKRTDADAFIALAAGKKPVQDFAIVIGGDAVGGIGYVPGTDIERVSAEVGYWLGEPYWGRGVTSAAVKALAAHIFATTDIQRLFATIFSHNAASMRVLEKAGFRPVGILQKAAVKNGHIIDLHYYELTK